MSCIFSYCAIPSICRCSSSTTEDPTTTKADKASSLAYRAALAGAFTGVANLVYGVYLYTLPRLIASYMAGVAGVVALGAAATFYSIYTTLTAEDTANKVNALAPTNPTTPPSSSSSTPDSKPAAKKSGSYFFST